MQNNRRNLQPEEPELQLASHRREMMSSRVTVAE
jgi:hypothetical protein